MFKKDNSVIRICVSGINGKMGRQLAQTIYELNSNSVVLSAALTKLNSKLLGVDTGMFLGFKRTGVIIKDNVLDIKNDFDVLVDFTSPKATLEYLDFCCHYKKNIVIGTTGFHNKQKMLIEKAARNIGIVFSPNFSVGLNVMLCALKQITKTIGKFSDINIIDIHHRNKIDSPSGTALLINKLIAQTLESYSVTCIEHNMNKMKETCTLGNVHTSSLRCGDTVGDHVVYFSMFGERLEIIHKAFNRSIYANGAIRSAIWLDNKIGLFDMFDVLSL